LGFGNDGRNVESLAPENDLVCGVVIHPELLDVGEPFGGTWRTDHPVKVIAIGRVSPPPIKTLVVLLEMVAQAYVPQRRRIVNVK
jgi:hypothetical protein